MALAGSADTVQAANPGKQSAGGISGFLFHSKVDKAQGPNAAAYDAERQRAHQTADTYNGLSTSYSQNAPIISNQFQNASRSAIGGNIGAQQGLASTLLQNNGEASRAQFQGNLDQSIAAQMAAANSTPGGAVAQAGAVRNAAAQAALMRAQGSATAAQLGAQEREAALGQAAGLYGNIGNQLQNQYGLEQTSAIQQAGLESQNQAQQNQMRLGYGQLGNQANAQGLQALNDYTSGNMAAQGLSAGLKAQDTADKNQIIGIGANTAGGIVGGIVSPGGGGGTPPPAAQGGAIGPSSNSIAAIYGAHIPAESPAPRTASYAEALAGVEALRASLAGHARADGGPVEPAPWLERYMADKPQGIPTPSSPVDDATAQWERSFGSADQARADALHSDNLHEAGKIRQGFQAPSQPSIAGTFVRGGLAGLGSLGNGVQAPDWSAYLHPQALPARAFGGAMNPVGPASADQMTAGGGMNVMGDLKANSAFATQYSRDPSGGMMAGNPLVSALRRSF